jgi:hypothetical protein
VSRTWKDKRKGEMGNGDGYTYRKKRAELAARRRAAAKNARTHGFACVTCWTLDQLSPGVRCSTHGGGIRAHLLAREKSKR